MAHHQSSRTKMKTFETLSGAAFMKMEPQEIAALSREELVRLAFRVRAIMAAIATYVRGSETTSTVLITTTVTGAMTTTRSMVTTVRANFDIQGVADYESMTTHDIAALSKEMLEQLVLNGQVILQQCPIKPGCRFCEALPDEYYLHVLLEWLTIEDQARFDMALLNHMDRRAHLHLLRDTVHGGVLSVSGKMNADEDEDGDRDGYEFNSGVWAWLESRNVFMRAVKFQDDERDIPAGFLARTGRQLLKLDLTDCGCISDGGLGKLVARCPRLEEVALSPCLTAVALASLAQYCPRVQTLHLYDTQLTGKGLARLGDGRRNLKKLILLGSAISDAVLGKIAEMCPNLEDVHLGGCWNITDMGVLCLLGRCSHIHTLNLSRTKVTAEGLARLGDGCRRIKKLHLNGSRISDVRLGKIAEMCPNLEDLDLGECRSITDAGFSELAKQCKHIHTLNLYGTQVTGEALARLEDGWRNMKKLRLSRCAPPDRHLSPGIVAVTDAGLGKIAEMCPGLEDVNLGKCESITEVGFSGLAKHCKHIHTLELHSSLVTGEGLARLGDGWRKMKKLNLNFSAISDVGLGKIAEMCPRLEEVYLESCSHITDVGISSLVKHCQHIHTIILWGTQVTDVGFVCLMTHCTHIRTPNLKGTQVTGEGLAPLGDSWRNLKKLNLLLSAVSDVGLGKIAEMCPDLEDVNLGCCGSITAVGISCLVRQCPHIHTVNFGETQITFEGLARLGGGWKNMKKLDLHRLAISDAGLAMIAEMCPNLEEIELYECGSITDDGVLSLARLCPKLRKLDLRDTQVTYEQWYRIHPKIYPSRHISVEISEDVDSDSETDDS